MFYLVSVLVLAKVLLLQALNDLEAAALTVYRNPDFFGHIGQGFDQTGHSRHFGEPDFFGSFNDDFFQRGASHFDIYHPPNRENQENSPGDDNEEHDTGGIEGGDREEKSESGNESHDDNGDNYSEEHDEEHEKEPVSYKYPGETNKPNLPGRPNVNVHFDDSPDFHAPPREVRPSGRPHKGRGPYGHPKYDDDAGNYEEDETDGKEEDTFRNQREEPQEHSVEDNEGDHEDIYDPEERQVRQPYQRDTRHQDQTEVVETKKGTREYLKHHKLPFNHESDHLKQKQHYKITPPKKRRYVYSLHPIYSSYHIAPIKRKRLRTVYIIQPRLYPVYNRRALNLVDDDSAYLINSELDSQYQVKRH